MGTRRTESWFNNEAEREIVNAFIAELSSLGCEFEAITERFRAIDVPPPSDIYQVYDVLERGQDQGLWLFEEGHVGHVLKAN